MPMQRLSGSLPRVPAVVGSLLGVVGVVVSLAGCSGGSSSSDGQDPVAAGEPWVQGYWDAAAARTRDQAPFLTEGVFFDHLTALDQWFVGRWRTIEWHRGYFGDEVDEMTYGQPYFGIDGVVYPYTVELEDTQDFAGLIWLQIGPDGVELVRQRGPRWPSGGAGRWTWGALRLYESPRFQAIAAPRSGQGREWVPLSNQLYGRRREVIQT